MKRIIDTNFWTDSHVVDNYSAEDKLFWLYLSTNPKTSQVGIYSLPLKIMSFETSFTNRVLQILLDRFENNYQNIIYNKETQEITVLDSLKFTIIKGGRPVSDLLKRELGVIKDASLIRRTYEHLIEFWINSHRSFDRTVMRLFETELIKRGLLIPVDSILVKDISAKNVEQLELQSIQYYVENYGELTDQMLETYTSWIDRLSENIVMEAMKRALNVQNPYTYSLELLEKWHRNNVGTIEDVRRLENIYSKLPNNQKVNFMK